MRALAPRRPVSFDSVWSIPTFALALFVICPPLVVPLLVVLEDALWAKLFAFAYLLGMFFNANQWLRRPLNENVNRVESALSALKEAPSCDQPIALILRSFSFSAAYHDDSAGFGTAAIIEPVLRDTGFRPCMLGRTLPLPPCHGVVMVTCHDDAWWGNFKLLASRAAVIFVFPEASGSLLREIRFLKSQNALGKMLLIMPPESIPIESWNESIPEVQGGRDEEKTKRWSSTRESWRDAFGLSLPEYSSQGALIELDDDGKVVRSTALRQGEVPEGLIAISDREDPSVYQNHYRVPFQSIWCAVLSQRQFAGPPLKAVWHALSVEPLQVGLNDYWRPPGDTGFLRTKVTMLASIGWGLLTAGVLYIFFGIWLQ